MNQNTPSDRSYGKSRFARCLLILLALLVVSPSLAADKERIVIPFDFVSKFDKGRYGQIVGDLIWKRLQREGRYVLPESMTDVRDTCERIRTSPTPDMPLDKVKKIVEEDFGGQVGIWGSVERAPGHEEEVYDLVIKCVDFSAPGGPKTIYECKKRTESVSQIPHVYIKSMVDALAGRSPGKAAGADPIAEENWEKNPNLIASGDFQKGKSGVPDGWEPVAGQQREPLGKLVRWIPESSSSSGSGNRIIRLSFDANVGDNEGLMYYSRPFPVEENAKYRFSVRWRTSGSNVKVFIKCYDEMATKYEGTDRRSSLVATGHQGREVYRSQQNLSGQKNTWNTHTEDFTPKHSQYTPRWGRVMLYAYIGAGVVDFDDVVVKQILPAPSQSVKKDPRRSTESKVSIKDMEENEQRSEAAKKSPKE